VHQRVTEKICLPDHLLPTCFGWVNQANGAAFIMTFNHFFGLLLAIATPVLSFLCVRESTKDNPEKLFVYRPVTMIVIIFLAILAPQPISPMYKGAIIIGLVIALMGDSLMMIPGTPFIVGLVSFSFVALLNFMAFGSEVSFQIPSPVGILILLYAVAFYWVLRKSLIEFWFPTVMLIVFMSLMVWQALEMFVQNMAPWSFFGLLGATLLAAAASLFAFRYFRSGMKGDTLMMMGAYHIGQWCLALSVWGVALTNWWPR
jgi:uncharacterized membrane protein YhhN